MRKADTFGTIVAVSRVVVLQSVSNFKMANLTLITRPTDSCYASSTTKIFYSPRCRCRWSIYCARMAKHLVRGVEFQWSLVACLDTRYRVETNLKAKLWLKLIFIVHLIIYKMINNYLHFFIIWRLTKVTIFKTTFNFSFKLL